MSVAKNYIYNLIYQVVALLIPFITTPYISRVLGPEGVGVSAYTNSIVQYFILFGTIGVALYGNRVIAYVKEDKEALSENFWAINTLKIIASSIALVVYIIYIYSFNLDYKFIYILQGLNLLAAAVDISWFFAGLEDFKKTVVRNLLIRVVTVACIFLFVKTSNDLWVYVFISGFGMLLGQLTMWMYVPRIVGKVKLTKASIVKHLYPSLKLFIPQIAIQVYAVLDRTMIGILSNTVEVGLYDMSSRIVKMSLTVVTCMGTVMLSRVTNTFAKGDIGKVREYLLKSLSFGVYLGLPITVGMAGIAKEFAPWFFGPGYEKTSLLIVIISPIIFVIAFSNAIGVQYLLPLGKTKEFTASVTVGAVINFTLNLILIPYFQSAGASIATVIAEAGVTLVQLYIIRKDIYVNELVKELMKYAAASTFMLIALRITGSLLGIGATTTFAQIAIGIAIYFAALTVLKSELNKQVIKMAKGIVLRR